MNPRDEEKEAVCSTCPVEDGDSKFVWDNGSGLYLHASSGFYHNLNDGWYYSSRDCLYYKFEDGRYVPFEDFQDFDNTANFAADAEFYGKETSLSKDDNDFPLWYYDNDLSEYWYFNEESKAYYKYDPGEGSGEVAKRNHEYKNICKPNSPCDNTDETQTDVEGGPYEANILKVEPTCLTAESAEKGCTENRDIDWDASNLKDPLAELSDSERPSEWIEEILINLYLKGYSNSEYGKEESLGNSICDYADIAREKQNKEIEEGERVVEDALARSTLNQMKGKKETDCPYPVHSYRDNSVGDIGHFNSEYDRLSDEDKNSIDEDNWRAQYGQVVISTEEESSLFSAVDMWDWTLVFENMKGKKRDTARLVGRLTPRYKTLHPSIQAGGFILKTRAICEVHMDLVRVTSGQLYRLRCPSARYVASLRIFNSSNPTQDWGFPPIRLTKSEKSSEDLMEDSDPSNTSSFCVSTSSNPYVPICGQQHCNKSKRKQSYNDRAAKRRILHGGIGIGPGQKDTKRNDWDLEKCSTETFASSGEVPHYSFGIGSVAR